MLVCALPIFHYLCTRKHQEQSSSNGLANRASSESRAKPVWVLQSRERGRALAQATVAQVQCGSYEEPNAVSNSFEYC